MLTAICINTFILVIAAMFLYKFDGQTFHKATGGIFSSLGILVLIFFIPIITYINVFVLKFVKRLM